MFTLELAKELMTSHCPRKRSAQSSLDAPPSARGTSQEEATNLAGAESVGVTVAEIQSVEECTAAWTAKGKGPVILCVNHCFHLFHTRH